MKKDNSILRTAFDASVMQWLVVLAAFAVGFCVMFLSAVCQ